VINSRFSKVPRDGMSECEVWREGVRKVNGVRRLGPTLALARSPKEVTDNETFREIGSQSASPLVEPDAGT
jgi:hypothetical protein